MDLEVEWSPEATEDLESIAEYIARDSEFSPEQLLQKYWRFLEVSSNPL